MKKIKNYPREALKEFHEKYPDCTTADLQTFVLGYKAGSEDAFKIALEGLNQS